MTAGHGVVHAEEMGSRSPQELHGVQLWLAQRDRDRHGSPDFRHIPEVLATQSEGAIFRQILGPDSFSDSDELSDVEAVDVALDRGWTSLRVQEDFEYGVVVLSGEVEIDNVSLVPGQLGYLGSNRGSLEVRSSETSRLIVFGGVPFDEEIVMWWNFVARSRSELMEMTTQWNSNATSRFPTTGSSLDRIVAPPPPWRE